MSFLSRGEQPLYILVLALVWLTRGVQAQPGTAKVMDPGLMQKVAEKAALETGLIGENAAKEDAEESWSYL